MARDGTRKVPYHGAVHDTLDVSCRVVSLITPPLCDAGKKVVRLEYEAYVPMARLELMKICAQVRIRTSTVISPFFVIPMLWN